MKGVTLQITGDGIELMPDGTELMPDGIKLKVDAFKLKAGAFKLNVDGVKLKGDAVKLTGDPIKLMADPFKSTTSVHDLVQLVDAMNLADVHRRIDIARDRDPQCGITRYRCAARRSRTSRSVLKHGSRRTSRSSRDRSA